MLTRVGVMVSLMAPVQVVVGLSWSKNNFGSYRGCARVVYTKRNGA